MAEGRALMIAVPIWAVAVSWALYQTGIPLAEIHWWQTVIMPTLAGIGLGTIITRLVLRLDRCLP